MKYAQHLAAAVGVILMAGALNTVSANLILLAPEDFSGTGLGAVNTILTIQSPDATTNEQGCVGRSTAGCPGGTLDVGSGDVIGGTLGGNEKTGASQTLTRTIGALGLTTAANLRVVFNAQEPGNAADNGITLNTLVLGIYDGATNALLFSAPLSAPIVFPNTLTGVGNSGFVFGLTAGEAATAQGFFALGNRIGLSSSASNATGGPETFFVANTLHPVPEPASLLLLGSGLAGLGAWRWRKGQV